MSPDKVFNIREKLGVSQERLAEILGLSSGVRISEYERGIRVPSKSIMGLLGFLDAGKITIEELEKMIKEQ